MLALDLSLCIINYHLTITPEAFAVSCAFTFKFAEHVEQTHRRHPLSFSDHRSSSATCRHLGVPTAITATDASETPITIRTDATAREIVGIGTMTEIGTEIATVTATEAMIDLDLVLGLVPDHVLANVETSIDPS